MKKVIFALISAALIALLAINTPAIAKKPYILSINKYIDRDALLFNFSSINKTVAFAMILLATLSIICLKGAIDIFHQPKLTIEDAMYAMTMVCISIALMIYAMAAFMVFLEDLGINILDRK